MPGSATDDSNGNDALDTHVCVWVKPLNLRDFVLSRTVTRGVIQ